MNQTNVTVIGRVATEPRMHEVPGGKVTNFRLATTERFFDKTKNEWRDGDTTFYGVSCWRALAENVAGSVQKGQPVIVEGRLHASSYDDRDGVPRMDIKIEARAVGHDLSWGTSSFAKSERTALAAERTNGRPVEPVPVG